MAGNVRIEGLDGVLDALKALPPELASKRGGPARAALARGAKVIRDDARRRVPVATGAVRDNIVMKRDTRPDRYGANERYTVGVRGGAKRYANTKRNRRKGRAGQEYVTAGNTYYWRFLEFGTAKMAARPFLRPAFESQKDRALAAIVDGLTAGIQRIAKKVAKGA